MNIVTGARRAVIAAVLVAVACTKAADDPEAEIRAFLARAENAVRERDIAAVKALIADDYRDGEGRDKRALTGMASYHFLQGGALHVATRLKKATFASRDQASTLVFAALARSELDLESLPKIDAEMYLLNLDLRRGPDGWQATRLEWRPATTDDLG